MKYIHKYNMRLLLVALLMVFSTVLHATTWTGNIASGSLGPNIFFSLDSQTRVLTVYGFGAMDDYSLEYEGSGVYNCNSPLFNLRWYIDKIIIEEGVTSIGNCAFYACNNLKHVSLPNGLTKIGAEAFEYCYYLKSIKIPASITRIGGYAFYQENHSLDLIEYESMESMCSIDYGSRSSATTIAKHVYVGGVEINMQSIEIPSGITKIGSYAFSGSTSLKSITIPSSVTSIGNNAFSGCSFTAGTFINTSNLNASSSHYWGATIADEITSDGLIIIDNTLISCQDKSVTSVTIPNSVTSIGNDAFWDCSSLTCVTIPNKVSRIGSYAFYNCSSLTSITIPNSVTSIDYDAFCYCSSLADITIPSSVTSIGYNAFFGCKFTTETFINKSNLNASSNNYWGATIVDEITTDGLIIKDNVLIGSNDKSVTSVTIPSSVTSIGYNAFNGCSSLTSITIPSSVTSIGSYAFQYCSSLTNVIIESNNIEIGDRAFNNCESLNSFYVGNTPPTLDNNVFGHSINTNYGPGTNTSYNTPKGITLYVPSGCKSTYSNIWPWSGFDRIVEIMDPKNMSAVDNTLYMEDVELYCGTSKIMAVKMKNREANITAFSFEMQLPEGLSVAKDADGNLEIALAEDRKNPSHIVSANIVGEGLLKIIAVSTTNKCFKGTDGDVLYITFEMAEDMEAGHYMLPLENITMVKADKTEVEVPYSQSEFTLYDFLFGDVNRDGMITISDAIGIINIWLNTDIEGLYPEAADANRDTDIDVADVVFVINIILNDESNLSAPARRGAIRRIDVAGSLFEVKDQYIADAREVSLPVGLYNAASAMTALQCIVELPQGVRLTDVKTQNNHQVTFEQQPDGTVRIMSISLKNDIFDNELSALTLELECDADFNMGAVRFSDIKMVDVNLDSFQSNTVEAILSRDATALEQIKANQKAALRYDLQGRRIEHNHQPDMFIEQGMIRYE